MWPGPWTSYVYVPDVGHAVSEYGEIYIFWYEDETWHGKYSHDAGCPWEPYYVN